MNPRTAPHWIHCLLFVGKSPRLNGGARYRRKLLGRYGRSYEPWERLIVRR